MKLCLVENELLSLSPEHLRVFKGICIGEGAASSLSERLLVPENKLK